MPLWLINFPGPADLCSACTRDSDKATRYLPATLTCENGPLHGQGGDPDDFQRSLPTLTVLTFCDSVKKNRDSVRIP